MFNNQLSSKELYSTNPSQFLHRCGFRTDPEDSAFSSSLSQTNSQIMSSQMENSQSSSFDMFSQMMSQQGCSQQTENVNNPQRFYMKYMSKPSVFNKETDKNPLPRKKSFQEQLDVNKQKAKERDDRDLINTFINLVKECTEEVKTAATDIRKDVDKNISESASQFSSLIQKINEDLKHYHSTLLDAVKLREDKQATLEAMQRDLAAREAKIEVLETQVAAAKKQRDERVVESVLETYTEQQQKNRKQMDKMATEQRAFCKTQMDRLQEEQERCLRRCMSEKDGSTPGEPQRREGCGDGPTVAPPASESDYRSCPWQGVAHYDQSGCHARMTRSYHENPGFQTQMLPLQANSGIAQYTDGSFSSILQPTFSNHGNRISLPSTSVAWSVPLETQNRELYPQPSNQRYPEPNVFNQSVVNPQARSAVPTDSSCGRENRPPEMTLHLRGHQVPPVMSPQGTSSHQGPWSANKLKPSPMAAVAPQVKPQEVGVLPSREQSNQDHREEVRRDATQAAAPRKKKGRKRYQVAVKTKKRSSRAKAKQKCVSMERKMNKESDKENQRRCIDAVQSAHAKRARIQPNIKEDVYEYKEEGVKTSDSKHKPQGKQTSSRIQQTSRQEVRGDVERSSTDVAKHKGPGKQTRKVSDQAIRSKTAGHYPRATNQGAVSSVIKMSRGKQKEQSSLTEAPSQDGIFSQARISTYASSQEAKTSSARLSGNHLKLQNQKPNRKTSRNKPEPDVISSEDEEYESQILHLNLSQDLSSQDESNVDREEQPVEPVKIQRKTKKQANKKLHTDKQVGCPVQPHVSQLDTMPSFSDQDDSSEEMIFSLKLPDSPSLRNSSLHQAKHSQQTGEQVVPPAKSCDILSTPYIQPNSQQDSDNESVGTTYSVSVGSGRRLSRHAEGKRRLRHYSGSTTSAAMVEITNSLRLQHRKISRVPSCR